MKGEVGGGRSCRVIVVLVNNIETIDSEMNEPKRDSVLTSRSVDLLSMNTHQYENKIAKENTKTKVGKKVVREREHELSCQINDFTWYKERFVFHL